VRIFAICARHHLSCPFLLLCLLIFVGTSPSFAQTPPPPTADDEMGLQPFQSYHGGNIDAIGLSTGTLSLEVPFLSYPQRGNVHVSFNLYYNNQPQHVAKFCPPSGNGALVLTDSSGGSSSNDGESSEGSAQPATGGQCQMLWGYSPSLSLLPVEKGDVFVGSAQSVAFGGTNATVTYDSGKSDQFTVNYTVWNIQTADGAKHEVGNQGTTTQTGTAPELYMVGSGPWEAVDATGWRALGPETPTANSTYSFGSPTAIIGPDGVNYLGGQIDSNGNRVIYSNTSETDSLGRQIPLPPTAASASNTTSDGCPQPPQVSLPVAFAVSWNPPGYSGGNLSYKFCYATVAINMPPYGSSGHAVTTTSTKLQSIVLPNGETWNFAYSDPGDGSTYGGAPVNYGTLTQVQLPTGGTISYTYMTGTGFVPGIQNIGRWVTSRTLNANDGTGAHEWTYSYASPQLGCTTVTDPMGNYVVHTFSVLGSSPGTPYETETQYYGSGGTLLKTESTVYSYLSARGITGVINVVPQTRATTWPDEQISTVTYSYDSGFQFEDFKGSTTNPNGVSNVGLYGKKLSEADSDYGGAPLRTTKTNYLALSNPSYLTDNLLDLVSSQQILDSGGTQRGYATYSYDENNGSPQGVLGNLTSVHRWLNTTGGYLVTSNVYNSNGLMTSSTDPNTNTTTYGYSSCYAGSGPTSVKNPLNQTTSYCYDTNTGLVTSSTDPNSQTTSYAYDDMARLTQITRPDGGQTNLIYLTPTEVDISDSIDNSGNNRTSYLEVDGLGRKARFAVTNGESTPYDETDTCYDADGRVGFSSYPYQDTGPFSATPCTKPGDSFSYDGIGRPILVTHVDGSSISTSYTGSCTTVTDEAGKTRETCTDGLGRLNDAIEDPSGLDYTTQYTYDALSNMTGVTQAGSRQRTFVYDSLSRLTSSTNPESNTEVMSPYSSVPTTYSYDGDGNLISKTEPAQNQQGTSAVTLSYCYDQLNRLTAKAYTLQTCANGTMPSPLITYSYDNPSCGGLSPCLNIGHRTGMVEQAGSETWNYSYNQSTPHLGVMVTDTRTTNPIQKTATYQYNHLNSLVSLQYPSGRTVNYNYNIGGRPISVVDGTTSVNYANAMHYWAGGAQCWAVFGGSATVAATYNGRLQPSRMQATGSVVSYPSNCPGLGQTGNLIDLTYNFNYGSGDNGNVIGITNNYDGTRSQNFTYDSLNRITMAETTSNHSTSPGHCWGETYQFDQLASGGARGNLTGITQVTGAYTGCTQESGLGVSVNDQNRITSSGYGYDTAGNMTLEPPGTTLVYDAENHLTSAAGVTYTYDGDGKRVEKSSGKIYWYGIDGNVLDETDLTGSTTNSSFAEYIFLEGARIGRRDASNNVIYYFADHLGTSRVNAEVLSGQNTATLCYDADFYPFGGERPYTDTCTQNYKFTGKERDSESGLDNFGFRYLTSSMGRFMSPDSIANDWELANPQTWNRYAYARNNPLIYVDPDGAAVELICTGGNADQCAAQRQAALQTLQNAVGNKAADSLYINEVKDGDNTRYFVGIKGDVGNFESLGSGAKDLGELVGAKQVVEFGLTDKDLPGNGAGQASYTYAPGEIGNANPRVLVNPGAVANASSFFSDTVFGGSFFGPGKIRDTTTEIAAFHEFGHVWKMWENINAAANGIIPGANGIDPRLNTSNEALRWENRMRIQVYGPLGPNNAQRIKHD